MPDDTLDMDWINALPQPIFGRMWGDKDYWWPINDFEVATGLLRMDVCGKLQASHIQEFAQFRDADGRIYGSEAFYADATLEERVAHNAK